MQARRAVEDRGVDLMQKIPGEIRPAYDPEGNRAVLMQFEHGYLVLPPRAVRDLCVRLLNCADEVEGR